MSASVPLSEAPDRKVDGRRARRHRSRDLAVEALLDLLEEGEIRPTAQQVAERSGVSLRSIFRIFDDVETLHTEAATRQMVRHRHLFVEVPASGALEERIRHLVETFDRLYATVAPVRRAALRAAPGSPALRAQLDRARAWARGELERVFAGELATADAAQVAAVEVALSFEAWDHCTTAQRLAVEERQATLARLLFALLG
jgi:TetR/AcrR family transcriptional regulator, regulator of autoinduction and epiphytic fitness